MYFLNQDPVSGQVGQVQFKVKALKRLRIVEAEPFQSTRSVLCFPGLRESC